MPRKLGDKKPGLAIKVPLNEDKAGPNTSRNATTPGLHEKVS